MKIKNLLPVIFLLSLHSGRAQKKVLTYPFQFEKSFLAKGDYDTYFLNNPGDSAFALVLKDNKKVEYVWLNKNFKVLAKVPVPISSTVLDQSTHHYVGGTATGSEYHFIYRVKSDFLMETVDFAGVSVRNKKLLELPSSEKALISFSDYNTYYSFAADDKAGELVIHIVNAKGELSQKNIPFQIPPDAGKRKSKLSNYLNGMKVVKSGEEPDMSVAVQSAKLLSQPGKISIVVNDAEDPTHIFSIDLSDFSIREKMIDYSAFIGKEDKGKVYISSFAKDTMLFSLILNKKNIRIAVHSITTGALLNKYEFTDESGDNLFAEPPVTEMRRGKKVTLKDVEDTKHLIKAFTRGTEGLMVTQTESGKLVLTAGTYDLIPLSSGGSSGGWVGGYQQGTMAVQPGLVNHGATVSAISVWNPNMYYRPGMPSYTSTSARYYTTTYFRLLLDPVTLKVTKGRAPVPVASQVKDYVDDTDLKAKATNQFNIGKNQYYGYYDKDIQAYSIEQIRIQK